VAARDMLHAPYRGLLYPHSGTHRRGTRVSRVSADTCADSHVTHSGLQISYNEFHPNCAMNLYSGGADGVVICVGVKLGLVQCWRN